jgi:hypothetical protein
MWLQQRPQQPQLSLKWCAAKLQRGSQQLLQQVQQQEDSIDALFAELDASLAHSRQVGPMVAGGSQLAVMTVLQ